MLGGVIGLIVLLMLLVAFFVGRHTGHNEDYYTEKYKALEEQLRLPERLISCTEGSPRRRYHCSPKQVRWYIGWKHGVISNAKIVNSPSERRPAYVRLTIAVENLWQGQLHIKELVWTIGLGLPFNSWRETMGLSPYTGSYAVDKDIYDLIGLPVYFSLYEQESSSSNLALKAEDLTKPILEETTNGPST